MSYANKKGVDFAPLALIGALGVVGYLAYGYLSSNGGSYIGGSGGGYYAPEGSPQMAAAGGYSLPTDNNPAPAQSYAPLNYGTTNDRANAQFITESKKEQSTNSDSLLRSAVSSAGYKELTSADIAAYNAALFKSIQSEDRTGGGSVGSALAFMGIGEGARYVAQIPNTAGISNAGANLTSIIYDSGAYEVRDWRGNIVGSGSAGSFQALGTATKKEEKTTTTAGQAQAVTPYTTATISGGGTYAVKSGSAYSYGGGGSSSSSKKESVNITADKASAISKPFTTATISGGGTYAVKSGSAYSYSGGSSSSSSSSSSKKSSVSSGGYAQGGAVRSNTTSSKYTG